VHTAWLGWPYGLGWPGLVHPDSSPPPPGTLALGLVLGGAGLGNSALLSTTSRGKRSRGHQISLELCRVVGAVIVLFRQKARATCQ